MEQLEDARVLGLLDAQIKAQNLFAEIEEQGLIRPARSETQINESIYALAHQMYGITRYWHKRIVRAGRNTLQPYDENPPDLQLAEDDVVFLDLGPVFEDWEADFGRTYVVGSDPHKLKLCGTSKPHLRVARNIFASTRHYRCGTVSLRSGAGAASRLGIWWTHRWTSDRRISSRADSRRQSHALCPSG